MHVVKRESEKRNGIRKREGKKSSKKKKVRLKTKQNLRGNNLLAWRFSMLVAHYNHNFFIKILIPGPLPRDSELVGLEWYLVLLFKNKK